MQRHRFKQFAPLNQRLTEQAERLRKEAKGTPLGVMRDQLVRQARQAETASHIQEWLSLSRPPAAPLKMLTLMAILAGPIVLTTIVTIVIFEIKDAWDRNRLR